MDERAARLLLKDEIAGWWALACLESSSYGTHHDGQVRTLERGMDALRLALALAEEAHSALAESG